MTGSADHGPAHDLILIIRTGSIGAFVQALGAFSAIRMHNGGAEITLVAGETVAEFAKSAPYFDCVEIAPGTALGLRSIIKSKAFTRIYDLDTSPKTARAFSLAKTWRQRFGLEDPVPWCGTAKGCALPHSNPDRLAMHISSRLMNQLETISLNEHPPVTLAWVSRAVGTFSLPVSLSEPFILLATDPGGANGVQWTPERFSEIAEVAFARGERPVIVGEQRSEDIVDAIKDVASDAVDLCGQASYVECVFLAWAAAAAIGTDNGLMHLIAAAGCRSVVLYDPGSDAALSGHRGPDVTILRRHDVVFITAAEVEQALKGGAIA